MWTFTIEPGTLENVSLVNSNDRVGEYGELTVEITTTHDVEQGGWIELIFPKWD